MRIADHGDLDEFISDCVDSLVAWDVVVVLHRNDERRFTVKEIAVLLGRPTAEVAPVVSCLRSRALLSQGSPFATNALFHAKASIFMAAIQDKQERLRILGDVLARQSGLSLSA